MGEGGYGAFWEFESCYEGLVIDLLRLESMLVPLTT